MRRHAPIGVFDSGVGGLTVLRALKRILPHCSFIYVGDTQHVPYGSRSAQTIVEFSKTIAEFLVSQGCVAIVIACNSASATAFTYLKQTLHIPVFDVITPMVAHISAHYRGKAVGLIATRATIRSEVYQESLEGQTAEIRAMATPLLVPMIEERTKNTPIMSELIDHYLHQWRDVGLSALILGCTHYPVIREDIASYLAGVDVIDSARVCAEYVSRSLSKEEVLFLPHNDTFYITDDTETFREHAELFFGNKIQIEALSLF